MMINLMVILTVCFMSGSQALTSSDAKVECPSENSGCWFAASLNLCFGKKGDVNKVWSTCPCSCMAAANERIFECCIEVSPPRAECAGLCRQSLTFEELEVPENKPCFDLMHILTYCGSEGLDVRPCCQAKGMSARCQKFCVGGYDPAQCGEKLEDYMDCLEDGGMDDMRYCYLRGLARKPTWKESYQPACMEKAPLPQLPNQLPFQDQSSPRGVNVNRLQNTANRASSNGQRVVAKAGGHLDAFRG